MIAPIAPEDLDSKLDTEDVLLPVSKLDATVLEALQQRRPLLLVTSDSPRVSDVLTALRPHVEIFIDRLIRAPELHIGDALQQVLDLGFYNARLGSLFETLWLARFAHQERQATDDHVRDLLETTFEDPSPLLRNDALLFWLTLLGQNGSGQVFLLLTSPGFDEGLLDFIRAAAHWAELGSPVRIVAALTALN